MNPAAPVTRMARPDTSATAAHEMVQPRRHDILRFDGGATAPIKYSQCDRWAGLSRVSTNGRCRHTGSPHQSH